MRAAVFVPAIRVAVTLCLVMSVIMVWEKLFMGSVSLFVRLAGRRPRRLYRWEPIPEEDMELGSLAYPMVLVQVPIFNEREVYQVAIGAVCNLSWPSDRLIVQVLDDSTDLIVRELVKDECEKWLRKGVNINLETRDHRKGYKAGALKDGMRCSYVQKCEYVAIFDADHQPASDFLKQSIPFLMHNPQVALVQARWKFVNADECLMTRIQEMSMDYHFKVEQEAGSSTFAFFGFNGTAGVWRMCAIKEASGWNERTTVEDMDLAVRASLRGWKFIFVGDIKVRSELPSTFKAYKFQQHRWACGPANLFRKISMEIITAKKVSIWKKVYLVYSFFFARKIVSHNVTFFFYTIVIPVSIFFPEVSIPKWGVIYIPTTITILNSMGTPSSFHLVFFWVLFEQVMSFHRCKAVYVGLLEAGRVNEWVVTEKFGSAMKNKQNAEKMQKSRFWERINVVELLLGMFLLTCASYDLAYQVKSYYLYMFPQSITFLIMGFGYVGNFVPSSS
ncbi:Glucomannan 4-beta-mannosyltransferase 9 [Apostasia shenzhenica]|uniref:glucomannan 4-beta-mannosyltransferase n=1 Tax=Apostasia shenzhenica TaxID=1088818 RepID=A0A2I0AV63_9ASPA|nr:Glucomannan 4-beta-mannosyltransferase 9 [Apostasia shenzhenica]